MQIKVFVRKICNLEPPESLSVGLCFTVPQTFSKPADGALPVPEATLFHLLLNYSLRAILKL